MTEERKKPRNGRGGYGAGPEGYPGGGMYTGQPGGNAQPGNGRGGYGASPEGYPGGGMYTGQPGGYVQPGNGRGGYGAGPEGYPGGGMYTGQPGGYAQPGNGRGGYGAGPEGYPGGGMYTAQPGGYAQSGNGRGGYGAGPEGYPGGGMYTAQPGGYAQSGNGRGGYDRSGAYMTETGSYIQYGAGQGGYAGAGGYGAGQGGYAAGNPGYDNRGKQIAGKGRKAKKKRKKWLFALEILILLILALGVFTVAKTGQIERLRLKDILTNEGIASQGGYRNLVLYGVDSREGNLTKDAHSDTIIICSINKKTKDIKMVSVYRDTYLDNTNGEYRKATECYYFGGPERSINMLNKNLDLDIKDYVAVDFNAVVKAVDLIGGIDMEITEEELNWLNGYCVENSQVTGVSYTPLASAGYQHLDGIQTLAYCRIRYTAGYDFKRTERQRMVLQKIFDKAKSQGVTTLLSLVDTMMPYISTSLSNTEILGLAAGLGGYKLGDNTGFPFSQVAADVPGAGDCVVPVNLAQNVTQLHEYLFGTQSYTPSASVQQISNEIINYTGIQ